MSEELKPCPFCGGEAGVFNVADYGDHPIHDKEVVCLVCEFSSGAFDTTEKAVEAWNRRTPPPAADPSDDPARRALMSMLAAYRSLKSVMNYAESVLEGTGRTGEDDE